MNMWWGPPPEDPGFPPPGEEWHLVREPDPMISPCFELPLSLGLGAGTFFLFRQSGGYAGLSGSPGTLFFLAALTIVLHEFLHALGHPGCGWGEKTGYGIWISRMAFYSRFDGVLARNRRLMITLLPGFILYGTPIGLLLIFDLYWWPVSLTAVINSFFPCAI